MQGRFPVARLIALTLVASAAGPIALAAEPYDVSLAPPLLGSEAGLGSVSGVAGSTAGHTGTGPCAGDDFPDGYPHAAVYRVQPSARAFLDLDVADDRDGSLSVCRVSLYRASALSDPFDAAQRATALVRERTGCIPDSYCTLEEWLEASVSYVVVMWATPPDVPDPPEDPGNYDGPVEAAFEYRARVRRPIGIRLSVSGHRMRDRCRGYHEVIDDRRFTIRANTSPNAPGVVRFSWYRRADDGTWTLARRYDRTLRDGNATLTLEAGSSGRRKVKARYLGSATMLPETEGYAYVRYVDPRWRRYADGGVKLLVRYYRQKYRLSCEAATLRMAHNYFHPSRIDDDMEVYRITGIDRRRPAVSGGCNPDRAFCGKVDGYMMRSGYGVHYGPIARAATVYDPCRPSVRLAGDSYRFSAIARHVANGYPVIVWGAHRGATGIYERRWTAWDGHRVRAWSVEHTWTVVGFRGRASYPTHFIVHNPSGSDYKKLTRAEFYRFVKYFKTAVVVRG